MFLYPFWFRWKYREYILNKMNFIGLKVKRLVFNASKYYYNHLCVGIGVVSHTLSNDFYVSMLNKSQSQITPDPNAPSSTLTTTTTTTTTSIASLLESMKKLYDDLEQVTTTPPPSPAKKTQGGALKKKKEEEEKEEEEGDPESIIATLKLEASEEKELLQLCKSIIEKRCGILNKVDEKILALEHAHRGWQHVSDGYGADLVDPITGARVEVKTSTVSKGKIGSANYQKTNWNFKLNWKIPSRGRVTFKEVFVHWAKKLLGEDSNSASGGTETSTKVASTPSTPTKNKKVQQTLPLSPTSLTSKKMSEVEVFEQDISWWRLLKISRTLLKADMFPKPSVEIEVADPVMALILTCITINNGGSMIANLGSSRCRNCGKYHRISDYIQNVYKNAGEPLMADTFTDFLVLLNVDRPSETKQLKGSGEEDNDDDDMVATNFSQSARDLASSIITKAVTNCKDPVLNSD